MLSASSSSLSPLLPFLEIVSLEQFSVPKSIFLLQFLSLHYLEIQAKHFFFFFFEKKLFSVLQLCTLLSSIAGFDIDMKQLIRIDLIIDMKIS